MKKFGMVLIMLATALCTAELAFSDDPVCGDVNASNGVNATDALQVLRKGVGLDVPMLCAPPSVTLRTGQTACFDASGSTIDCGGTEQDGDLRHGIARSFTDNGDGTVSDNKTGLMWEKLSNDGSIHDKDNGYTWSGAFGKIAVLNVNSFAGYSDWRLPNLQEIETLRNLGATSPATFREFDQSCDPGCTPLTCSCTHFNSGAYWSSTTFEPAPEGAWSVNFTSGYSGEGGKVNENWVRAVRGGWR